MPKHNTKGVKFSSPPSEKQAIAPSAGAPEPRGRLPPPPALCFAGAAGAESALCSKWENGAEGAVFENLSDFFGKIVA